MWILKLSRFLNNEQLNKKMKKNYKKHNQKGKGKQNVFIKIWNFLWKSNSIWSWIVNLIIIFLIVKFVVFPFFGFMLGSPLPFVIIESSSMIHEENFDQWFSLHGLWYLNNNITKEEIEEWSWNNGLNKGDIIIVRGLRDYNYDIGDVIIFKIESQETPIIHRIVNIEITEAGKKIFSTKGDHNDAQWDYEILIMEEQILGKSIGRVPKLGWLKLFFVELFK